jgi:hypothetical protein
MDRRSPVRLIKWTVSIVAAMALVACSKAEKAAMSALGGTTSYTIGGSVSGLGSGLSVVLQDNGGDNLTVSANGSFTFATKVASSGAYAVTILTQPTGQTCTATGASGTATANVTSVAVACTTNTPQAFTIGGSVTGLATSTSLVLQDNGGDNLTVSATGSFMFATQVASGSAYAVTILTQPTGQTCTVAQGSGTVNAAAVTTVSVTCASATSTPTLGGVVIGLTSGVTVHVLNGTDNVPVTANGAFTFPTKLASGATYSVSVGTPQPTGQTCAVQYGSGTAASANITSVVVYCTTNVTAASLTGPYTAVTDHLGTKADGLVSATFDGVSSYSGSVTLNTNTVITNSPVSGNYTVVQNTSTAQIPVLTLDGTDMGAMEFNANTLALLKNATGGAPPRLEIGVKQAQNASVSTVNGSYTMVSLESTSPASGSLNSVTLSNGTATSGAAQRNTNGAITTLPASPTGTYTVTPGGAITAGTGGNGISGAISADGDLLVLAPITSNGNGSTPGIYVAVKQGSGVTTATLNGVYTLVSLSTSTAAGVGRYYSVGVANGAFAGTYIENNSTTSTNNIAITGTYTAAADGTMTAVLTGATGNSTLTGTMSADGNVFVLSDLTSGEAATLLVGLRQ